MREERGVWINNREAARIRLGVWARVYRALMMAGAPNPNYYAKSVFVDGKIDPAAVRRMLENNEDLETALEVDGWLQEIRSVAPNTYEAVLIHYVEREPGGIHRPNFERRMELWNKRTGLGQRSFYNKLNEAERYIGFLVGVSDEF